MPHVIPVSRIQTLSLGLALLSLGGRAVADRIVLKNGRRILALSAVEEGDKVKYLTTAGELSWPKSIVDHIEKGSGALMTGPPGADAATLAIAPPAMKPTGQAPRWNAVRSTMGRSTANTSRNWKARLVRENGRPAGARRWDIIWLQISNLPTATWNMRSTMLERR